MKTCERAIFELLSGFAEGRVFALRAPQDATAPFIVFQRIGSNDRWRSVNNPSGIAQATIQIDVYASDYYSAKDLAANIENAIDGYKGTVNYGDNSPQDSLDICGISVQDDTDLLDQSEEPLLYRNSADYLVTYKQ